MKFVQFISIGGGAMLPRLSRPGSFEPVTDMRGGGFAKLETGQWTDDTSMALCLTVSLIECQGFDPTDRMQRYVRWFRDGYLSVTGRCFDICRTTHLASTCLDACRYLGGLIVGAVHGVSKDELLSRKYSPGEGYWTRNELCEEVALIASGSFKFRHPQEVRGTGYVAESLEAAL